MSSPAPEAFEPASPVAAPPAPDRPRVLVLFGGRSSEHAISCVSAGSVLSHLDRGRVEVIEVGITREGRWVLPPDDGRDPARRWGIHDRTLPEVTGGSAVALLPDPTRRELISLEPDRLGEVVSGVDVVFPVLHGPGGEDGDLQGLLETAGLPYVGAGVGTSAAAMDKVTTKAMLRDAGIPVVDAAVLTRSRTELGPAERERLGLPVFVKPARAGSSVGISRVGAWDELDGALALARRSDPKVLVEAAVVGREIECAVLQFPDGHREASAPAEIRVTGGDAGWYDFETKYLDDACELDVPATLDDATAERVRTEALRVAEVMEVEGLARIDFFVRPDGSTLVNELNTMPGFTTTSLYPRMWQHAGLDYPTLLHTLLDTALARPTGVR